MKLAGMIFVKNGYCSCRRTGRCRCGRSRLVMVGEFYAADWLEPLDVSDEVKADMPTLETFTKDGKVLAIPYANDYRLSYYNTEQFEKAGITEEPQTWEDVLEACRTLKSTGTVEHPFAIALNAEEKTTTCLMWLAYTMNGVVYNEDGTLNERICNQKALKVTWKL